MSSDFDDPDQGAGFPRRHKRSLSDPNFETYFNHRNSSAKEHDDSSDHNSMNHIMDSDSPAQEKLNLKNRENEFKILMYLDEKNDADDDSDHHDHEEESGNKEKNIQVEKKLDFLFRQEVPLSDIYYDNDSQPTAATKPPQAQSDNINSFFSNDMGKIELS